MVAEACHNLGASTRRILKTVGSDEIEVYQVTQETVDSCKAKEGIGRDIMTAR